ncbi:hypothetical protein MJ579_08895 [Klebsiella pneumoniae]|nr:hypothetical protein MJ579_08895 [Klebsiella pneumoniae]
MRSCSVSGTTPGEKLVRTAARLAARTGSVWHAVYVETPSLPATGRRRRAILAALRLAPRSWGPNRHPLRPVGRKRSSITP